MSYYESPNISQSDLKALSEHPRKLKKYLKRDISAETTDPSFLLGDIVDIILTEPDSVYEKYVVNSFVNQPTGKLLEVFNYIFSNTKDKIKNRKLDKNEILHELQSDILSSFETFGQYKTFTNDVKLKRFEEKCLDFYLYKLENEHKIAIKPDVIDKAKAVTSSLYNNSLIVDILKKTTEGQKEIYWNKQGVDLKSKLDLYLNLEDKHLVVDIKTTFDFTLKFSESFYKYRYDIQAAYYTDAIKYLIEKGELENKPVVFIFIVESTSFPGTPLIYRVSPETMEKARQGFVKNDIYYKGYHELLEEYKYHIENDVWDYPMSVYENNYIVDI